MFGGGRWKCQCECGNTHVVSGTDIRRNLIKSCGCLKAEKHLLRNGEYKERLYHVWRKMKSRCSNEKDNDYKHYGARGIKVCEEWLDYHEFRNWATKNGYDEIAPRGKCTLDRINFNGNYEPLNCRWVDMKTQIHNRRKRKDSCG